MLSLSTRNLRALVFTWMLLIATLFRLAGLFGDLPETYYDDENYLVHQSLRFGSGDLNPHEFINPTFYKYLLFFAYAVYYVAGKFLGAFAGPGDFVLSYLRDPTSLFLIGRLLTCFTGVATVLVLYLAAKGLFESEKIAFLAGFLLSVTPLHVEYSHFATVDVPMTFLLTASFLFIVNIYRTGAMRFYVAAGVFAGLAAATKYTAGILVFWILLAHLLHSRGSGGRLLSRKLCMAILAMPAAFLLACPFALLDYRSFLVSLVNQWQAGKFGWWGWEPRVSAYKVLVLQTLWGDIGPTIAICAGLGLILGVLRDTKRFILLGAVPLLYCLYMGRFQLTYERFMLPVVPFVAMMAAWIIVKIPERLFSRKRYVMPTSVVMAFLISIPAICTSLEIDRRFFLVDTRSVAKNWVERSIPRNSKILIDRYCPNLRRNEENLRRVHSDKLNAYGASAERKWFYDQQRRASRGRAGYDITEICHPVRYRWDEETPYHQKWMTTSRMKGALGQLDEYDYVIVSSTMLRRYVQQSPPDRFRFMSEFYRKVTSEWRLAKEFKREEGKSKGPTVFIYSRPVGS